MPVETERMDLMAVFRLLYNLPATEAESNSASQDLCHSLEQLEAKTMFAPDSFQPHAEPQT